MEDEELELTDSFTHKVDSEIIAEVMDHEHDPNRCVWKAGHWECPDDAETGSDDRTRDYDGVYHLTEMQGKQVQEILRRYVNEELIEQRNLLSYDQDAMQAIQKDIDYINDLAELFD